MMLQLFGAQFIVVKIAKNVPLGSMYGIFLPYKSNIDV